MDWSLTLKNIKMKKIYFIIIVALVFSSSGCKKYLDINSNPNGPSQADPALYLASIESQYAWGVQFDARALATIVQNWSNSSTGNTFAPFEQHGYIKGSDASADLFRNVYWKGGFNTIDMINNARAETKWDLVGIGLALQAWGWQMLTDYHGELPVTQAFRDPTQNTFPYDSQDTIYAFVKNLCMQALDEFNKTGDGIGSPLLLRFDLMYKGNVAKWKKFVYGILALNEHHLIKKSSYNADNVIKYVDSSFAGNSDDAIVPFAGTVAGSNPDANFFGPLRSNLASFGQSGFIVRLTDGSVFGSPDPRRLIMLTPSTDGVYRGLAPYSTQSSTVAASSTGVKNMWGVLMGSTPAAGTGKYLFQDKAPFPLMTYSMMQFIKAEAALKKGDNTTALSAYTKAINASLDFVQIGATAPGATPTGTTTIFPFNTDATVNSNFNTQKAVFLANPSVIPTTGAGLTIQMILLQKFIALWSYGFIETWVDMRKYDYSSTVYTTLTLPSPLFVDNAGKLMYRMRPRYNSEYIWNIDALTAIGGFNPDYQTYKMWIQLP
jgi:hypothetical protein